MTLDSSLSGMSPMSWPSTVIRPSVGFRILFRHLISVDFPTPFGPIMQTSPGSSITRSIPCRTGTSP